MRAFLTTQQFEEEFGARFRDAAEGLDRRWDAIAVTTAEGFRVGPEELERIEIAFLPGDFTADAELTRRFLGSALRAPSLAWMHLPNAGVDHPVFAQLLARGVRLTTSSGASAEPIAQTAIGGMLALARGFPAWSDAQRRHAWEPRHLQAPPADLRGQVAVVVGLGAIGRELARLARAIGLRVIGVRRSPRQSGDPVDELIAPSELRAVLPRADWLVLACPLTGETRGLIDAAALARLRPHARLINVARGAVVDETALIAALAERRLAGAYLDVFAEEPLPAASPLWDMPDVLISPHDSSGSAGNVTRQVEIFLRNLAHWVRGEPLENEVRA